MIRVPSVAEYKRLPFSERQRVVLALRALLVEWLETERP